MKSFVLGYLAAAMFSGCALAQTPIERGDYLVNGLMTCGNCHTPRGPGGVYDLSRQLSGGPQTWDEETFKVKGANITPDPETGIGKWSSADIKKAILTGFRPNGTQLAPMMPYGFYKVLTTDDVDAIVAYVKSVPAVRNAVEPPIYKSALYVSTPKGADKAMSEADMPDPVKRGFYLVTIAHCMECHTPLVNDRHDFAQLGKGGQIFMALDGGLPVGCVALKAMSDGGFEVAKMTVAESHRGTGLGRALLQRCIDVGAAVGAPRLYLETNTRLGPAIGLYRALGFHDLPPGETPYDRCDVFMERTY